LHNGHGWSHPRPNRIPKRIGPLNLDFLIQGTASRL